MLTQRKFMKKLIFSNISENIYFSSPFMTENKNNKKNENERIVMSS